MCCYLFWVKYLSIRNSVLNAFGRLSVGESIASSAVKTSIDINVKLIIVLSETGKMANYVAKFRYVLLITIHAAALDSMSHPHMFHLASAYYLQARCFGIDVVPRLGGLSPSIRYHARDAFDPSGFLGTRR